MLARLPKAADTDYIDHLEGPSTNPLYGALAMAGFFVIVGIFFAGTKGPRYPEKRSLFDGGDDGDDREEATVYLHPVHRFKTSKTKLIRAFDEWAFAVRRSEDPRDAFHRIGGTIPQDVYDDLYAMGLDHPSTASYIRQLKNEGKFLRFQVNTPSGRKIFHRI